MRPARHPYGPHPAQYGELWLPGHAATTTGVIVHGGFWRARYDLSLGGRSPPTWCSADTRCGTWSTGG